MWEVGRVSAYDAMLLSGKRLLHGTARIGAVW